MFGLGAGELLLIALFALIFIGPKKLPELAKGLGKGLREFQKAKDELLNQVHHPDPSLESSENTLELKETASKVSAVEESDTEVEEFSIAPEGGGEFYESSHDDHDSDASGDFAETFSRDEKKEDTPT